MTFFHLHYLHTPPPAGSMATASPPWDFKSEPPSSYQWLCHYATTWGFKEDTVHRLIKYRGEQRHKSQNHKSGWLTSLKAPVTFRLFLCHAAYTCVCVRVTQCTQQFSSAVSKWNSCGSVSSWNRLTSAGLSDFPVTSVGLSSKCHAIGLSRSAGICSRIGVSCDVTKSPWYPWTGMRCLSVRITNTTSTET